MLPFPLPGYLTEEICGSDNDVSLGSEAENYSAVPASKHMSSEPQFQ